MNPEVNQCCINELLPQGQYDIIRKFNVDMTPGQIIKISDSSRQRLINYAPSHLAESFNLLYLIIRMKGMLSPKVFRIGIRLNLININR